MNVKMCEHSIFSVIEQKYVEGNSVFINISLKTLIV